MPNCPTDDPLLNDLLRAAEDVLATDGEGWALLILRIARDGFLAGLRPPDATGGNGTGADER